MMNPVELVVGLILAAAVLSTLARKIKIPYPVLLVMGGIVLGFVPGLPIVHIPPDIVFLVFITPLVYIASTRTTLRDFRSNLRPILVLSIGLVAATLVVVAAVMHWSVPGLGWAGAFVLASIIGPTDTMAVTAISSETAIPRRIGTILEGESLINDIVALVAYKMAIDAVSSGSIPVSTAVIALIWNSAAGIAVGLVVGIAACQIRKRLEDQVESVSVSLLTGYAAYLGAEMLDASGILATVTAGLYVGRQLSRILLPEGRIQAYFFWDTVTFLIEGLAFVLIGLELRTIMEDLGNVPFSQLVAYGLLISVTVILLRLVWVFGFAYLPRIWPGTHQDAEPPYVWQHVLLLGWAGMRGVDSLAAALAIPLVMSGGQTPFPDRNLIMFLSFCVIVATLVVQGLSLPFLIRRLELKNDNQDEVEEGLARIAAAEAALHRLEQHVVARDVDPEVLDELRSAYGKKLQQANAQLNPADCQENSMCADAVRQLREELLMSERQTVIELRDQGKISDDVLRRIERSLDYEFLRQQG
ncbi:Na+/H+ antiporter [Schlesneria sp. DSM 10557]|uniref:Na+/H+ antiporter n=1 Tax=Schlesneria sp. DSM 10557 TaxID=3044399 RepID=UPI00359FB2F5